MFVKKKCFEVSAKKCARIHMVQTTCNTCPEVLANENLVEELEEEKNTLVTIHLNMPIHWIQWKIEDRKE